MKGKVDRNVSIIKSGCTLNVGTFKAAQLAGPVGEILFLLARSALYCGVESVADISQIFSFSLDAAECSRAPAFASQLSPWQLPIEQLRNSLRQPGV